jgi:hypothetical protein
MEFRQGLPDDERSKRLATLRLPHALNSAGALVPTATSNDVTGP